MGTPLDDVDIDLQEGGRISSAVTEECLRLSVENIPIEIAPPAVRGVPGLLPTLQNRRMIRNSPLLAAVTTKPEIEQPGF